MEHEAHAMHAAQSPAPKPMHPVRAYLRKFYSHPDFKHTVADLAILYAGTKVAKRLGNQPKLFRDLAKGAQRVAKRGWFPKAARRVGKTLGNLAKRAERRAAGGQQARYVLVEKGKGVKKGVTYLDYTEKSKITTRKGAVLNEGQKTRARPKFTKKVPRPKKGAINLKMKKHYPKSRSGRPGQEPLASDRWVKQQVNLQLKKQGRPKFIGPKLPKQKLEAMVKREQLFKLKKRFVDKNRTRRFRNAKRRKS